MDRRSVKVLFTIPNFVSAGSGKALANILLRFDRAAVDPAVAVLKPGGDVAARLTEAGIPVHTVPFLVAPRPYAGLPARAWSAARSVRRLGRFDVWHSWHYADDYTEPIIARLAGAQAWVCTKKNMSWGGRAWRLRCGMATYIVAQNREMLTAFFSSPARARKTRLIPRGVDTARYQPDPARRRRWREELALAPDDVAVGTAATLIPLKGHRRILEAVVSMRHGCRVFCAGGPLESDYARELRDWTRANGMADRVRFLGHVADMPGFLNALDIFVLATRRSGEGSPVALLEAMAASLATVATDVPGSRDVVENGHNGRLVSCEDPGQLAAALDDLCADHDARARLGAAARSTILGKYTIEREVEDHVRLYRNLGARSSRGADA